MKKTKLYQAILVLSVVEINRFLKYLNCTYAGDPPVAMRFMSTLLTLMKDDNPQWEDKHFLWHATFGTERAFDDGRFRKLCSDGIHVLEEFLGLEWHQDHKLQEATTRLRALNRKGLESLYQQQLKRTRTLFERWPTRGAPFHYHRYVLEASAYDANLSDINRFKVANIEDILYNLDIFYVLEKIRYYVETLSRKSFLQHTYEIEFLSPILEKIEEGAFKDVPGISMYYQIIKTHLEPDQSQHYYELKNLINKHKNPLPPEHLKSVYFAALNYCLRKINQGKKGFLAESFEMYKQVLNRDLAYDEEGNLSHWTFKNVIVLALRLGEFSWAKQFLEEFGDRISIEYRRNAVTYNLAQIYFYQKDFERVLSQLQEVEYKEVTYNLGAKTMLMATYFELQEWQALNALSDSFRLYIQRRKNTLPDARRRSYLNLIKLTLKLYQVRQGQGKIEDVEKLLEKSDEVASEIWVREKIKQLKNPYKQTRPKEELTND